MICCWDCPVLVERSAGNWKSDLAGEKADDRVSDDSSDVFVAFGLAPVIKESLLGTFDGCVSVKRNGCLAEHDR